MFLFSGKFFQEFEIPAEYEHLWRYMHHMYLLDAFTQSCPADQDIINHYKLQQVGTTPHYKLQQIFSTMLHYISDIGHYKLRRVIASRMLWLNTDYFWHATP